MMEMWLGLGSALEGVTKSSSQDMTERAFSLIQIPLLARASPAPLMLLIPHPQPRLLQPSPKPDPSTPLWYLPNLLQSLFPTAPKHSVPSQLLLAVSIPVSSPTFAKSLLTPPNPLLLFFFPLPKHIQMLPQQRFLKASDSSLCKRVSMKEKW